MKVFLLLLLSCQVFWVAEGQRSELNDFIPISCNEYEHRNPHFLWIWSKLWIKHSVIYLISGQVCRCSSNSAK